jgi:hypothetical protein
MVLSFIIFFIGPKYFGHNKISINKESVVFEGVYDQRNNNTGVLILKI